MSAKQLSTAVEDALNKNDFPYEYTTINEWASASLGRKVTFTNLPAKDLVTLGKYAKETKDWSIVIEAWREREGQEVTDEEAIALLGP